MNLYPHQKNALETTADNSRVAYYLDMGLGKTFVGSEKLEQLGADVNLVVCQKSKVSDWVEHFETHYNYSVYDLTDKSEFSEFVMPSLPYAQSVGIINYELAFRRPELKNLTNFTLMLDESSMIQNETAKRSKFILKLNPENVILLSGTPTSGKYEKLWSQVRLLGWNISKELYWKQYVNTKIIDNEGYPIKIVTGYKNVGRLKLKLREHGAIFMKSDEVFDLPKQIFTVNKIKTTKEYKKFKKDCIIKMGDTELVGDTTLTKMLYERMLCGQYNQEKLNTFRDILDSTEDRIIVFYNFYDELDKMKQIAEELKRKCSCINGTTKDLSNYDNCDNSVTFVQYQSGAMGLNLQKSNKIIYFTPPLSSEFFEQSKKRTHRIGQERTCFYYELICENSIEEKIYNVLKMRKNYTERLFENE